MLRQSQEEGYGKEDAIKTLEIINSMTSNCDTKASIILGVHSVFISTVLSIDNMKIIKEILEKAFLDIDNGFSGLYLLVLVIGVFIFIYGIGYLVSVIVPRFDSRRAIKGDIASILFYGSIAKANYGRYSNKVKGYSKDDFLDDLLSQIFSCSKICDRKMRYQKKGLIYSIIGMVILGFMIFLGYIIYMK